MNKKRGLNTLIVVSIISIILFSYLVYVHYKPEASEFCNFGGGFNCDIVNKSIYSELFGIPVALLGILTFLGILVLSILSLKNYKFNMGDVKIDGEILIKIIFWVSAIGLLFALYLIYIEAFVLYSFCIFCLVGDGLIIITLVISYLLMEGGKK